MENNHGDFIKMTGNPEKRFTAIRKMASAIQDKQIKKEEIRNIAESIELMADTKWIEAMNRALDDVKKGRFVSSKEFLRNIKSKGNKNG